MRPTRNRKPGRGKSGLSNTKELNRFKIAYADALNAFELMVFQFISTVREAMSDAGLKDPRIAHAALARQTAEPLNWIWYSTFYGYVESDVVLLKHLKTIRNFNTALIAERNVLAHTAFWGHASRDIANEGLHIFRLRHTAEGAKSEMGPIRTRDLDAFKISCDRAADAVLKFSVAVRHAEWRESLDRAVARLKSSG